MGWNVQPWVGALTWENKRDYGSWKALKGGVSERFAFPQIKGKNVVKSDDLGTEKGKEGHRLEVGGEHPAGKKGA